MTEDQVTQSITVDEVDVVNNVIPMYNPSISCHFIFLLPIKNIYIDFVYLAVLENSNNSNDGENILLEANNDNILVNVDQFKTPW